MTPCRWLLLSSPRVTCRHGCSRKGNPAKRGLCYVCAWDADIRALYPSTHPKARRGVPDANRPVVFDAVPCMAEAGSERRIETLTRRAAAGLSLYRPGDLYADRPEPPVEVMRSDLEVDDDY